MNKTFCILPWRHLYIETDGSARICCKANEYLRDTYGRKLTLDSHSLQDIYNCEQIRSIRQRMAEGKTLKECAVCYLEEKTRGGSYRTQSNADWLAFEQIDEQAVIAASTAAGHVVDVSPRYYQLNLGNLCNLKCRMCGSNWSSQIERDPVHSKWAPGGIRLTRSGSTSLNMLGAAPLPDVAERGFHAPEIYNGKPLRWTNGVASLEIRLDPAAGASAPHLLQLDLWGVHRPHRALRVVLNGTVLHDAPIPEGDWSRTFAIDGLVALGVATRLELLSNTFQPPQDSRQLGVAVKRIAFLTRNKAPLNVMRASAGRFPNDRSWFKHMAFLTRNNVLLNVMWAGAGRFLDDRSWLKRIALRTRSKVAPDSMRASAGRFPDDRPWFEQRSVLYDEILSHPEQIRELYFTGGEPFINKELEQMLEHLVALGQAHNIILQFNTNATMLRPKFVQTIRQFKKVKIALSLDGVGRTLEYIRFPAKWEKIERNIRALAANREFTIMAMPIVQSYNMLTITELFRFCDEVGVGSSYNMLYHPNYLSVYVMPLAAREVAANRIRDYADTVAANSRQVTMRHLADGLLLQDPTDRALMQRFMEFTNDMDISRGQDFREAQPELYEMIVAAGVDWSPATRFATVEEKVT